MTHHAAQNALVRMLYDPAFAEAVHSAPASTGLAPEVLRLVAAVDPRALRGDPLRRRRTLGMLVEEWKASSTLVLAETRRLAMLEAFFGAPEFHASVEERTPMSVAFGAFLLGLCTRAVVSTPQLPDVIAFERMQARARREAAPALKWPRAPYLRLAPGCVYGRLGADVLACVQATEQYLFEVSLLPQLGLCDDGPRPLLPQRPPGGAPEKTIALLAVSIPSGLSMVTLDDETAALLEPLGDGKPLARERVLARAAHHLGLPRARALLAELEEDEVLEGRPSEET